MLVSDGLDGKQAAGDKLTWPMITTLTWSMGPLLNALQKTHS